LLSFAYFPPNWFALQIFKKPSKRTDPEGFLFHGLKNAYAFPISVL
jgi:hypothetical protein